MISPYTTEKYIEIETELDQILMKLNMEPSENRRSLKWLKDLILISVYHPDGWQDNYLEIIGKRENLTRERVRQMLYKAAWDNWNSNSKNVLEAHLGCSVKAEFEYFKPNHIDFINLISDELRKKYLNY